MNKESSPKKENFGKTQYAYLGDKGAITSIYHHDEGWFGISFGLGISLTPTNVRCTEFGIDVIHVLSDGTAITRKSKECFPVIVSTLL